MAVNDTQENVKPQPQFQAPPPPRQSPVFGTSGRPFGSLIGRGGGPEIYTKIKKGLEEIYKESQPNIESALIDLDKVNNPDLAFSCIIVAARLKDHNTNVVAFHILVLEATGDKLTPRIDSYNGKQIEILQTPATAVDQILVKLAISKVAAAFPNRSIHYCDACIVPADFNPDDKNALYLLASNAGMACVTELEVTDPNFRDLSLNDLRTDRSLVVDIELSKNHRLDIMGHPVRSDLMVTFASRRNQNSNTANVSLNNGDGESVFSQIGGYVDLIWNPPNAGQDFNQWANPNKPPQTQKYIAEFVITSVEPQIACTPAAVLFAIGTALVVGDGNNWVQVFKPSTTNGKEIDLCDIGALDLEANLKNDPSGVGEHINTKVESFTLQQLGMLVSLLIQPDMVVSLDCPESGPQAWYLSVFADASRGSMDAQAIVLRAFDELTNGSFSRHFKQGDPLFINPGNMVHNGYWTGRNGQIRDIREFDHLAVCNLVGEKRPKVLEDFTDTYLQTKYPIQQRLYARKNILTTLSNETCVITGLSTRVTFSSQVWSAYMAAVRESQISVKINTPLTGTDFNNQRATGAYAGAGIIPAGHIFNNEGYGQNNTRNGYFGLGGYNRY